MSWDFETDVEYQQKRDRVTRFVRDEIEPLERVLGHPADVRDPRRAAQRSRCATMASCGGIASAVA